MNTKQLRIKLLEKEMTVPALAQAIGISQATMYVKMSGKSDFTYPEVMKIKKVLNLDVEEFNLIFGVS